MSEISIEEAIKKLKQYVKEIKQTQKDFNDEEEKRLKYV